MLIFAVEALEAAEELTIEAAKALNDVYKTIKTSKDDLRASVTNVLDVLPKPATTATGPANKETKVVTRPIQWESKPDSNAKAATVSPLWGSFSKGRSGVFKTLWLDPEDAPQAQGPHVPQTTADKHAEQKQNTHKNLQKTNNIAANPLNANHQPTPLPAPTQTSSLIPAPAQLVGITIG